MTSGTEQKQQGQGASASTSAASARTLSMSLTLSEARDREPWTGLSHQTEQRRSNAKRQSAYARSDCRGTRKRLFH